METKRIFLIIVLIISLIMISWSTYDYFEYPRYNKLTNVKSYAPLIKNMNSIPDLDSGESIFVVLQNCGNIPNKTVTASIASLLDQTVRISNIFIVTNEDIKLPEHISNITTIIETESCSTSINDDVRYLAQTIRNGNAVIIGIIPDKIFGKDFLYSLIEKSHDTNNSNVISSDGNSILVRPDNIPLDTEKDDKIKTDSKLNYKYNYKI